MFKNDDKNFSLLFLYPDTCRNIDLPERESCINTKFIKELSQLE